MWVHVYVDALSCMLYPILSCQKKLWHTNVLMCILQGYGQMVRCFWHSSFGNWKQNAICWSASTVKRMGYSGISHSTQLFNHFSAKHSLEHLDYITWIFQLNLFTPCNPRINYFIIQGGVINSGMKRSRSKLTYLLCVNLFHF